MLPLINCSITLRELTPSSGTPNLDGTLPHYQLGDLGLIPRPKHHIASNTEKIQELSATTRLGTLKKILTKSVGIQTVSAPKVRYLSILIFW